MGCHLPDRGGPGRAGGPGLSRRVPPGGLSGLGRQRPGLHRDHPARADRRLRGPDRPPGRRALPAAVRAYGHLAHLRGRAAGAAARGRGAGQGRRDRHVLHVRRPDRRHLVAGAAAAGPGDHRARRPGAPRTPGLDRRRRGLGPDRREDHLLRAGGRGRTAARLRRAGRRADPDPAQGQLLREGRQAAGDRLHPAVVHPQRRPRRRAQAGLPGPRRGARLGAAEHEVPLRQLGGRAQRRLADLPAALLRRALPGLVHPRRVRGPGLRAPHPGQRGPVADRPELGPPAGVHRGAARASRAASPPIRT